VQNFTFIDLFAGLGGFRIALQNLGGTCVFSSEWDKKAQETYEKNFGEKPFGDITLPEVKNNIPENFDVLCAGFPCQPFSKGGFQNGFEDTRGTLFFDICEIVQKHQPKYILLENVANLVSHDNGNTYKTILKNLKNLGYSFPKNAVIVSPDKLGVPILRPRVFIPCVRKDFVKENISFIENFKDQLEKKYVEKPESIDTIIDFNNKNTLTDYELKILTVWDEFYQNMDQKIIGFPIWLDYFKNEENLDNYPKWKANFIQKNKDLYQRNKPFIDKWLKKYHNLDWAVKTHKKMEWQAGETQKSVFDCLIQFRPSGVRIKKPDRFSTLVAMNHQQIIGKLQRRISINECKKLQSFPDNYILSDNVAVAMKQLGNSVNVKVVQTIMQMLFHKYH
jgi:DNA (cytosine-5)-methyltransferase 1